jgi:hypothetical protein
VTSARTARLIALFLCGLAVALTVRYNTFAAWATDSGAYLAAAQAWARADLFTPATFVFWAPWSAGGAEFPFGHVQGPVTGTITGQYPLGYPLLLAAALRLGGDLAPHLVSPLLLGVLAWCAFLLARRVTTSWAGVLATLMTASTPVALSHAVIPFSDVPSTALWAVAWVMSLRPGHGAALASGAAAALAVMIRPNLAPLALVIAATVVVAERTGWKRAVTRFVAFGVTGMLGPVVVLWSQDALYGHPLQNGYRASMSYFFDLERVPYNAGLYPRMLAQLHSWVVFGGLLYAPFALRGIGRSREAYERGVLVASALGIILVNYVLYLAYLTYVGWYWLRFMLPAMLALFVLLAAGVDHVRLWLTPRWPRLAFLAVAPAVFVAWVAEKEIRPPVGYERIQMMQRYLPEVLPPNAVILTQAHGGAIASATGRPIVRLDVIDPNALDGVVRDLRRRGYRPVYVFDVAVDADFVGHRFRTTEFGRLTWPARAELASTTSVVYYDIADRDRFLNGERWVTDVVVAGRSAQGTVRWTDMRAERERIILPLPDETAAFRTALDALYRDQLGRAAFTPAIDPGDALGWLRRYLRLRLHGCTHDGAADRLWYQLTQGTPPVLCALPDAVVMPAEDESIAWRRALEERLRGQPIRQPPTYVDALGEVVWMQRYIGARLGGCSHEGATRAVTREITSGEPVTLCDN